MNNNYKSILSIADFLFEDKKNNPFLQVCHYNLPYYFDSKDDKFGLLDESEYKKGVTEATSDLIFMTAFIRRDRRGTIIGLQQKFNMAIDPMMDVSFKKDFHYRWSTTANMATITKNLTPSEIKGDNLEYIANALHAECKEFIVLYSEDFSEKVRLRKISIF